MWIIEPGSKFLPEKGRYTLYVSRACPSSHSILMVRALKGLQEVVSVVFVRPHPEDHIQRRWVISHEIPDDSLASLKSHEDDFHSIREIYEKEHDNTSNSIPLLYDNHHECIVNNDAADITNMLNSSFADLCENPSLDLLCQNDAATKAKMNEVHDWLYPLLQLAPSNTPPYYYDLSPRTLQHAFDRATCILQKQRYLTSHTLITEADLKLFVALIRYEEVYSKYLVQRPPQQLLLQNPALMDYCRDIYQLPGVANTVHMGEIRAHFLGTADSCNSNSSATLAMLQVPHRRHLLV